MGEGGKGGPSNKNVTDPHREKRGKSEIEVQQLPKKGKKPVLEKGI